ncbi:hypothetical protein AB4144_30020, partial [Rhizobiaceae sp. 2RAB30]
GLVVVEREGARGAGPFSWPSHFNLMLQPCLTIGPAALFLARRLGAADDLTYKQPPAIPFWEGMNARI